MYHGATNQILVDAHPHIGTNKLPKVVKNIRETILKYGGEIHFETRVTDFTIKQGAIKAITLQNNQSIKLPIFLQNNFEDYQIKLKAICANNIH